MNTTTYGIYSTDMTGTGSMLAFGTEAECWKQIADMCHENDVDLDAADYCCVQVTPALADSSGESWAWLPGSGESIACTRAEADD